MTDFGRNNLGGASSPYLRQHRDNPIHWQEWNQETLDYAERHKKLLFVSIGYATCHWCHVMAAEAFSDAQVARFLNEHFVSIKIDREQRPDIDQVFMDFIVRTTGHGGWPLNVFLTPDRKPITALTYAPAEPGYGMPAFIDVLRSVNEYGRASASMPPTEKGTDAPFPHDRLVSALATEHDAAFGGFGRAHKFPPHTTLLFLLGIAEQTSQTRAMLETTLDSMVRRGLHDHLQGGFFRYCVDREWTIPHFEKMLYDQALLLWVYSAAYKVLQKESYRRTALRILKCVDETFAAGDLFVAAHDADTDHKEGATYLWTRAELKKYLGAEEFAAFADTYAISEDNFEGKIHLVKKNDTALPSEEKLLAARKQRRQPFVDTKIITSWNALAGIGLVMLWRCLGQREALKKAERVLERLLEKHYRDGRLAHSSLGDHVQREAFLEDYAAVLLLVTYLHEETGMYGDLLNAFTAHVRSFKKDEGWIESANSDFGDVAARSFDHPMPSSISLAEYALLRTAVLLGNEYDRMIFKRPLEHDFNNLAALLGAGEWHILTSPEPLPWDRVPLNAVQVRAAAIQDCYGHACRGFATVDELIASLQR